MISNLQLLGIFFSLAVSVGFPLTLLLVWRRKTRAPFSAAAVGAAMFFLFAMVLEQLLHHAVLRPGGYILTHPWAYILYGTLAAGIFEETGRLVGFRFLLRKHSGKETGVMYGIGHGGMEALLVCALNMALDLVLAFRLNAAGGDASVLSAGYQTLAASLQTTPAGLLAVSGVERVIAVCFHIALSVLVFEAVKRPGKLWLYPAAILLHAGLDVFATLYQLGILKNIYALEGLIALAALAVCLPACRVYRLDRAEEKMEIPEESAENG